MTVLVFVAGVAAGILLTAAVRAFTPHSDVTLTHREAQTALGWYADAFTHDAPPAGYDRALAEKLGTA